MLVQADSGIVCLNQNRQEYSCSILVIYNTMNEYAPDGSHLFGPFFSLFL